MKNKFTINRKEKVGDCMECPLGQPMKVGGSLYECRHPDKVDKNLKSTLRGSRNSIPNGCPLRGKKTKIVTHIKLKK